MTIQGAIYELNNMLSSNDIPCYWKPVIKKIIETVEQSEQNVGMCQQNVGEMSEKQIGEDLISRTDLLNAIWQKEYGKDYDGVNMLDIQHIDIIENMPSAEQTTINSTKTTIKTKYCPNCGAKMKGGTE